MTTRVLMLHPNGVADDYCFLHLWFDLFIFEKVIRPQPHRENKLKISNSH